MPKSAAHQDPHWDYVHNILKNTREIVDAKKLERAERSITFCSSQKLLLDPIKGHFDQAHLQAIHKHLFERIYPWAGELRRIDMHRRGSYGFTLLQFLQPNLNLLFERLSSDNYLKGLDSNTFTQRAARLLGELNTIHPFREGNGRTQREFIRELAAEAGHRINWKHVTQKQMYDASIQSHNLGNHSAMVNVICTALESNSQGHILESPRQQRIIYKRSGRSGRER
jgi:cell filamentation protein